MMVLTTSVAVLIGCVVILMWRCAMGSAKRTVVLPSKSMVRKAVVEPEEVDDGKKKITIFYGTQTSTTKGFAKALAEEAKARYEKAKFRVIYIIWTAMFYKWFTEEKDRRDWLKNLQYGIFGFRNQQCEHLNKKQIVIVVDNLVKPNKRLHHL